MANTSRELLVIWDKATGQPAEVRINGAAYTLSLAPDRHPDLDEQRGDVEEVWGHEWG